MWQLNVTIFICLCFCMQILDQGPYMISLEHLVDHYMRFSDGLPIELKSPISTKAQLPPKIPSPSQALISKQRARSRSNEKEIQSSSSSSNASSTSGSTTVFNNSNSLSPTSLPTPRRDMPKPKLVTSSSNGNMNDNENLIKLAADNANNIVPSPELPPRVPPSRDPRCNTNYPTNLRPIDKRKKYENNETLRRIRHSR